MSLTGGDEDPYKYEDITEAIMLGDSVTIFTINDEKNLSTKEYSYHLPAVKIDDDYPEVAKYNQRQPPPVELLQALEDPCKIGRWKSDYLACLSSKSYNSHNTIRYSRYKVEAASMLIFLFLLPI
jgi:hypothetical protein